MHEEFFVSTLFNHYIANPIAERVMPAFPQLGGWIDYHPGHDVLPPHLVMIVLVSLGLTVCAAWMNRRLSVDDPGVMQQTLELTFGAILDFMKNLIGAGHKAFFPIIGSLFLFILTCNLLGLFPGFMSPTSNINVTAGCAIIVFVYYNFHGFKTHGFAKYMAHFAGPSLVLAPLLFVIEIISHMARPFSLSVRLFGNIFAEEMIIAKVSSEILPFLIPLPVMMLALFASTIQAFIFVVLTMVYIGGAVEHAHEEHDNHQ
jgi:F-type H+-transporting ATPase subunit a